MKRIKVFPKTIAYTLGLMLFIVGAAHVLLYFFTKPEWLVISVNQHSGASFDTSLNVADYVTKVVRRALPLSLICCVFISVICSFLFSRKFTVPIKHISAITEQMAQMKKDAVCNISSKDEIGRLADNINDLVDFLRAASHELKTPVTALNAILENMILGIGKYKDYDAYLPECKEITEHLAEMIHDILEASKADISAKSESAASVDLSELLSSLCEPYGLIAKTRGITFSMDLSNGFSAVLPPRMFEKAISNIIANAVAYTETGKTISVYFDENHIMIENECVPIPTESLRHIFEPFYRPDFDRNRCEGGNGLGLYITDTFLKTMGIPYSFCPMEEPQGMRFTISL